MLPFYGHKFTVAVYRSSLPSHSAIIFPVTFISIAIKYEYEKVRLRTVDLKLSYLLTTLPKSLTGEEAE